MLVAGLVVFTLSNALPLVVDSAGWLIASRAATGRGAALIMPATLSIINAGRDAFMHGMWLSCLVLAGVIAVGAVGLFFLPRPARR